MAQIIFPVTVTFSAALCEFLELFLPMLGLLETLYLASPS